MRFLALSIVLLSGPTVSLGIGEFEKKIEDAKAIEQKITLAEEGFRTIEGFVPRELLMSFWSIDALGEIVSFYKSILDSKGIEALIPEYSNILRICMMEMGDYRYFFEPLKAELDALMEDSAESSESTRNLPSKGNIAQNDDLSFWTVESIRSLIEFWFLSGYGQRPSDVDDLLKADWSDSDIEYWDLVFSTFHHCPNLIITAMKDKLLVGHADIHGLSSAPDDFHSLWTVPEIAQSKSEVSTGGPRLELY
jgi:hypothetical protein